MLCAIEEDVIIFQWTHRGCRKEEKGSLFLCGHISGYRPLYLLRQWTGMTAPRHRRAQLSLHRRKQVLILAPLEHMWHAVSMSPAHLKTTNGDVSRLLCDSRVKFGGSVSADETHLLCRPGWWWSWVCSAVPDISLSPGVCKCCWWGTHLVPRHLMSHFWSRRQGRLPVCRETWWPPARCLSLWVLGVWRTRS